jgi:hypothetical protein
MNNNYLQKVARSASKFSNYGGSMDQNTLSQLNRTLTVVITNATTIASTYVLFGYNQYGTTSANGVEVTTTINESSYNQVLRETATTPYEFVQAKFNSANATNLSNVVTVATKEATGKLINVTFTPLTYQEPENNNTALVRIPDFNGLILDGTATISGAIAASSTITYILTLKAKSNLSNSLDGSNIVVSAGAPAPNGMAPIQLTLASPNIVGAPATQPGMPVASGAMQANNVSRFY